MRKCRSQKLVVRRAQLQMARAGMECLETRVLLTQLTTVWTGAVSSDWSVAGNWSNGIPINNAQVTYMVLIDGTAVNPTIRIDALADEASADGLRVTGGTTTFDLNGLNFGFDEGLEVARDTAQSANLSIIGGGRLTAGWIALGAGDFSSADLDVRDPLTELHSLGETQIAYGEQANATISVQEGTLTCDDRLRVARGLFSTGRIEVTQAASVTVGSEGKPGLVDIGRAETAGTGHLLVSGGSIFSGGALGEGRKGDGSHSNIWGTALYPSAGSTVALIEPALRSSRQSAP